MRVLISAFKIKKNSDLNVLSCTLEWVLLVKEPDLQIHTGSASALVIVTGISQLNTQFTF